MNYLEIVPNAASKVSLHRKELEALELLFSV